MIPRRRASERFSGLVVLLVCVDVAAMTVALILNSVDLRWAMATLVVLVGTRLATGTYRRRLSLSFASELPRLLTSVAITFGLLAGLTMAVTLGESNLIALTIAWSLLWFVALGLLPQAVVFAIARWARRRFGRCERALVVGTGSIGNDLVQAMLDHPEFGLKPIGFLDTTHEEEHDRRVPLLPLIPGKLSDAIIQHRAGTVVLAVGDSADRDIVDLVIAANHLGATVLMFPRMHELYRDARDVERIRSFPLVRLSTVPTRRPSWWIKRTVDRLVAVLATLVLAPLLLAVTVAVAVESGRPILFKQDRVGLDGHIFRLLKFRSLRPATQEESDRRWTVAGDPRIGPVGRFLRRTAIDELPQLWNIVCGDMSLVGPRPERPGFVEEFSAIHDRYWARHRVPAGLTGLAQVNGLRGDTSIADRSRYDNYYIANWSLWLDVRIIVMTVREVFRRGQY